MNVFFIGLIIFVLLCLLLFVPFSRRTDWHKNYRQQKNIELYQQQMAYHPEPELADELAQRLLADQKQLENRPHFLSAASSVERQSAVCFNAKISALFFVMLIALPAAYYFSLDRFDYVRQGQQDFLQAKQKRENADAAEKNDDYILSIQNKLRQDPNNGEAWIELGQAYMLNNEFDNALKAYGNAEGLLGSKAHILGLAATTLYYEAGQRITPRVRQLIDAALRQDPKESSSLSLLASEAFLTTDYDNALQIWQQLLDSGNSDIDRRRIIQSMQMAEQLKRAQQ